MKPKRTTVAVLAVLVTHLVLSGCATPRRDTPEATVKALVETALACDYDAHVACIAPGGLAKLGMKGDKEEFAAQSKALRSALRGYETETLEIKDDKAVVRLVSYGVVDGKGKKEVQTFEVLRIDDRWLVYTDIDTDRSSYPIDKALPPRAKRFQR